MKRLLLLISYLLVITITINHTYGQDEEKDISKMTKEDVLALTYDELLAMPFEDLLKLADIVGVSPEELYEMILNADITAASKKAESSFEAPLSTSVITKDEIMNSGATSIPEALRLVPGIIVREKTNGNYDVHIRGNDNVPPKNMLLYSENTISLIMVDNMPVYNYGHGGTFWESFPIDVNDIERIEIIRGPSSALYGPNAVSGAINIVTVKPEASKIAVAANAQFGNLGTTIVNGSVAGGAGDHFKYRVSGNYQYRERFQDEFYAWNGGFDATYNVWQPGYYSKEQLLGMLNENGLPVEPELETRIPDPSLATDKYGVNGFLFYDLSDDIKFHTSVGYQNSEILTNIFGDHGISVCGRTSETQYINFGTKIYGLNAKVSYIFGTQNAEVGNNGFQFDIGNVNATLEYEYIYKNLTLRPGLGYQQASIDDTPYIDLSKPYDGLFNGKKNLSATSYYLRADYVAFEKLRLIAAVRGESYSKPSTTELSYQFIGSYNLNDKQLLRLVYSKANRGPFMSDVYTAYNWEKIPGFTVLHFAGNDDYTLASMKMAELGYRVKPVKNIQADIELFYTQTGDFSVLTPDFVRLAGNPYDTNSMVFPDSIHLTYLNTAVQSNQTGVSFSINTLISEKLQVKLFGTFQKTRLENYNAYSNFDQIAIMADSAGYNGIPLDIDGNLAVDPATGAYIAVPHHMAPGSMVETQQYDSLVNIDYKSTPAFYGGLMINYAPLEKLNINTSVYFYSEQTFIHLHETSKIDAKTLVNLKISYKVWRENAVFVNVRNLLNIKQNEFAFLDESGGLYLVGLSLNF